jgi:predicted nucleic acid-binding protein
VDLALHDRAISWLKARSGKVPSLVDAVSFAVMRERGIREAFAFDEDFQRAGFRLCKTA